ncbi:MAG: hypothetical protein ACTH2X_13990, partial [Brachybacterium tyrofermentans]
VYYSLSYLGFLLPTILAALTPVLPYTGGLVIVAVVCALCLLMVGLGLRRPIRSAQDPAGPAADPTGPTQDPTSSTDALGATDPAVGAADDGTVRTAVEDLTLSR